MSRNLKQLRTALSNLQGSKGESLVVGVFTRNFGTSGANRAFKTDKECDKNPCLVRRDDLIACPEKKKENCEIDIEPPCIGYYDLGYCRPPCDVPRMRCPPPEPKCNQKKKPCCDFKESKYKIKPCKKCD